MGIRILASGNRRPVSAARPAATVMRAANAARESHGGWIMKKLLYIAAIASLALSQFALAAAGAEEVPEGKRIYTEVCSTCHGADAGGDKAPNLKSQTADALLKKLAGYRAGTYGASRKAAMEGLVKKYTPEQLESVVKYIKTL